MTLEKAAATCTYYDNLADSFIPFTLPRTQARADKEMEEAIGATLAHAVPWDPKMRFQPFLAIHGESYNQWVAQYTLDADLPLGDVRTGRPRITIPDTDFYYCNLSLPKAGRLRTISGKRRGSVVFDTDVVTPCLRQKSSCSQDSVWMSFTPMEVFTLRAGIRSATGHVVIAGLGLGYQLIEIAKKKSVRRITLVERNYELFDWVWPRIRDRIPQGVTVLFGDAREIVPKLKADRAVVDIDKNYGYNYFPHCPNIGSVWVWGSTTI